MDLPPGHKIKVLRNGRDYEVHTKDGIALTRSPNDVAQALKSHMPSGFKPGAVMLHRTGVRHDVPDVDDIDRDTIHVLHPHQLAAHGVHGNDLSPEHVSSIHDAWQKGTDLDPVQVDVTPGNKWHIEDGNHRVHAAAQANRHIAVQFRKTGHDWAPQSGSRDISDRIIAAGQAARRKNRSEQG